ncbi:hypothetical protein C0585_04000 [Candidatus Woesearchaeota archaeon]|nr:MAG: hypothetical protein C0585_04000 [Candidatus Woesearchaeota archaeon]
MIDEQTLDWIRNQKNNGFTAEQIGNQLLQKNHTYQEIEDALMKVGKENNEKFESASSKKTPLSLKLIAIGNIVFGAFGAIISLLIFIFGGMITIMLGQLAPVFAIFTSFINIFAVINLLINIFYIYLGISLLKLKNWARITSLVFVYIGIIMSLIGVIGSIIDSRYDITMIFNIVFFVTGGLFAYYYHHIKKYFV